MPDHDNFYDNLEEVNLRLKGTIVNYDGEPCYIQKAADDYPDGKIRLFISMLPLFLRPFDVDQFERDEQVVGSTIRKRIDSRKFDNFRPVKLGYCNFFRDGVAKHCSYLSRVPVRRSKQGLSPEALHAAFYSRDGAPADFSNLIKNRSFYETIKGIYPSFEEILPVLVPNSSVAFSREFCLYKDYSGIVYIHRVNERIAIVTSNLGAGNPSVLIGGNVLQYKEQLQEILPRNIAVTQMVV